MELRPRALCFFFFNDTATTEIYTLSLHDALPISWPAGFGRCRRRATPRCIGGYAARCGSRSEEHTSELQSRENLVCRLLLEKKKKTQITTGERPKFVHTVTILLTMSVSDWMIRVH